MLDSPLYSNVFFIQLVLVSISFLCVNLTCLGLLDLREVGHQKSHAPYPRWVSVFGHLSLLKTQVPLESIVQKLHYFVVMYTNGGQLSILGWIESFPKSCTSVQHLETPCQTCVKQKCCTQSAKETPLIKVFPAHRTLSAWSLLWQNIEILFWVFWQNNILKNVGI